MVTPLPKSQGDQRDKPLSFRPHHFMCANGFEGKGYSPGFVENFSALVDRLRGDKGDDVLIQVVSYTDDICRPCPHRRQTLCAKQALIESLDQRHLKALGLSFGQVISWGEAKRRIVKFVTDEAFEPLCQGCGWQKEGICLKALRRLRHELNTKTEKDGL